MPNVLPNTPQEEGSKAKAEMQIRRLAEHGHHLLVLCPPMCVYSIPAVALKTYPHSGLVLGRSTGIFSWQQ
jgi:hypothetical protein